MKVKKSFLYLHCSSGFSLMEHIDHSFCPYFSQSRLLFPIDLYLYILDNYLLSVIYMKNISCCVTCIFYYLCCTDVLNFNTIGFTGKFAYDLYLDFGRILPKKLFCKTRSPKVRWYFSLKVVQNLILRFTSLIHLEFICACGNSKDLN